MPHFDALNIYSCGIHCEKRRNCLVQAISPFLTMFSMLFGTYFPFSMQFEMSSALCFNLDQSKILLSGNGLTLTGQQNNFGANQIQSIHRRQNKCYQNNDLSL